MVCKVLIKTFEKYTSCSADLVLYVISCLLRHVIASISQKCDLGGAGRE